MKTPPELLRSHLWSILTCWDAMLRPTKTGAGEAVTGSREAPLPIPVGILSLRRFACEQLGAWVHLIYEERELSTTGHDLNDAKGSARFITTHAEWLMDHPAGRDALNEIADLDHRITSLVTGSRVRRFTVGACPEHGMTEIGERVPCEGELFALIRSDDALLPSELRCTIDPQHVWTAHQWQSLSDRIHGGPRMDIGAARNLLNAIARDTPA